MLYPNKMFGMFLRSVFVVVSLCALASACSWKSDVPMDFPTPPPAPLATPIPKLDLKPDAELEKQFAKIAEEAKGKVGVMAVVIETGESASLNADGRYPMQSVYKLPICMAVMDQVRLGKLDLDEQVGVTKEDMVRQGQASPLRDKNPDGGEFTIRELIRLALVESDGTASDVLLRIAGGPAAVQEYLSQIGIHDMKVVNSEKELGSDWDTQYENWATPAASVELLRWLDRAASPDPNQLAVPDADEGMGLLIRYMSQSTTGPNRLKRGRAGSVPHKTGTGGTRDGVASATNDIGIFYLMYESVAIAVYVSDSTADEKTRESVIAKIAKAAEDRWRSRD
jgi:beta-lactamase class A